MARSTPTGAKHTGWHRDAINSRLEVYYNGAYRGHFAAAAGVQTNVAKIGTVAAALSNAAGAIIAEEVFIAPAACKIVSAWAMNISASDVTKGTSITSLSYRRVNLICNTAAAGVGTDIVASLNATASAASWATRAFTMVASTVPAGGVVRLSHLSIGAATADGSESAARVYVLAYELV